MMENKKLSKPVAIGLFSAAICTLVLVGMAILIFTMAFSLAWSILIIPFSFCVGYGGSKLSQIYEKYIY